MDRLLLYPLAAALVCGAAPAHAAGTDATASADAGTDAGQHSFGEPPPLFIQAVGRDQITALYGTR